MNLTYRDVDFDSQTDHGLLARWHNDPESKHLYSRFTDAESFAKDFTPECFQRMGQPPPLSGLRRHLMVLFDEVPIGLATFEIDPLKRITPESHTAWFSLMIGEKRLRRQGLGRKIMTHLEDLAAASGAQRAEIGIFAYNERSLRFFTALGYEELLRRPQRAWWNGRMWPEVRLFKTLQGTGPVAE